MSGDNRQPIALVTEVVVQGIFEEVLRSGKRPSPAAIAVATKRLQQCLDTNIRTQRLATESGFQSIVEMDELVIEAARVLLKHLPGFVRSERDRQVGLLGSDRPERQAFGQKMQQEIVQFENLLSATERLRDTLFNRPTGFSAEVIPTLNERDSWGLRGSAVL